MPKGLPEHRKVVKIRAKPDYVLDADPFGIASTKPVRDAERRAMALAPWVQ